MMFSIENLAAQTYRDEENQLAFLGDNFGTQIPQGILWTYPGWFLQKKPTEKYIGAPKKVFGDIQTVLKVSLMYYVFSSEASRVSQPWQNWILTKF